MEIKDIKLKSNELFKKYDSLIDKYDIEPSKSNLLELKEISIKKGFWDNNEKAQSVLKEIKIIETEIEAYNLLKEKYSNLKFLIDAIDEDITFYDDFFLLYKDFKKELEQFEINNTLNGIDDKKDAIIAIHPGAGGLDSQDWAGMLLRLYERWSEKKSFKTKIISYQGAEEAGIKEATLEITGQYAYGLLKGEMGVHRLVRISPFNSNGKRHTSFASIFVYPVIDDSIDIDIDQNDIRIDTYRASGAGGQHINKTDSAVRITHIPSGIVVQCQNERSQLKNKNYALKMLKAKLYQMEKEQINSKVQEIAGTKKDIGFGNQIRSYVFHPYNLVKDHRTNIETSSLNQVIDGDIDLFIRSFLLSVLGES